MVEAAVLSLLVRTSHGVVRLVPESPHVNWGLPYPVRYHYQLPSELTVSQASVVPNQQPYRRHQHVVGTWIWEEYA